MTRGPNTLGSLLRAETWLLTIIGWAIAIMLAGMVVVVSLQVASRYFLDASLIWSEEVARLLFICMVFLGAALLQRRRAHLAVTALVDLLPDRLRHLADALVEVVALACAVYLLRGAWATLLREWDQRTPGLQIPMGLIFGLILGACVLLLVWIAANLGASLADAARGRPYTRRGPETGPETEGDPDGPT